MGNRMLHYDNKQRIRERRRENKWERVVLHLVTRHRFGKEQADLVLDVIKNQRWSDFEKREKNREKVPRERQGEEEERSSREGMHQI
ncbi:Uncharacterized protein TCM_012954 [Theobroma cacao]|uniref:Uncharacterized protein n=1 Tax=Theobroma cacao TaxID=3641 RepID=A0A061FX29_THECC|nr:Uncharacterized protein TCM_012954 [Theobroma cacao]